MMHAQGKPDHTPPARAGWRRLRVILPLGLLLLAGAFLWLADWQPRLLARIFHRDKEVIFYGPDNGRRIAVTIDDGPSPATGHILDSLARHNTRATFFLMAGAVAANPELVRRIVREGHEIGNHLWEDQPAYTMSREKFREALEDSQNTLTAFAPVRWFRPPHAVYTDWMLADARELGLTTVIGSLHPYDTALPSVEYAVSQIVRNSRPGDILVLHDGEERGVRTAQILDRVLPVLVVERSLTPGPLSDLLR